MKRAGVVALLSLLSLMACAPGDGADADEVIPCEACEADLRTQLRVTTAALPDGEVGVAYVAALTASGGRQPYSWTITGALPAGLVFDAAAAKVSGTPSAVGAVTFTAVVRDAVGQTASRPIPFSVIATTCDTGCVCPAIDAWKSIPLGGARTGNFKVEFDTTPGAAPTDLVVGLSSGTATAYTSLGAIIRFSGNGFIDAMNGATPGYRHDTAVTYEAGKSYHFVIDVDTAAHVASYYVTPEGGQQVTLGARYGFRREQASATSFDTLNTIDAASIGSGTCDVSVTSASAPLVVSTTSLPSATAGAAYTATLAASGGTAPYRWSLSAGALPAGLGLDAGTGKISGTPAAAASAQLTVKVSDAGGTNATKALALTVVGSGGGGSSEDGFANAPICAIQYPSLLDGYAHAPTWHVAGVDYCAGYPAATALKDPATIAISGVAINTSSKLVTITGNNVTLDGYDFSLAGGWGVVVNGGGALIQNSRFKAGANRNKPILGGVASANLTVRYCSIDGNNDASISGLIEQRGSGTLTIEYAWLRNAGGDIVQFHTGGQSATGVLRFNVIENAGMAPGAHGDYTEWLDGPYSATIVYNTTLQNGGTTQGIMVEPDIGSSRGTIVRGEIGHNTFTARGGLSYFTAVTVADVVDSFTVHDNFFDDSNVYGFAIGGIRGGPGDASVKTTYRHNVDMVTGNVIED